MSETKGTLYSGETLIGDLAAVFGKDGKSAYEVWLDEGYTGTEADFLASLKGDTGATGADGVAGADGEDGTVWHYGTMITGTGTIMIPILNARLGDYYLNSNTFEVYVSVGSGEMWSYLGCIKGKKGDPGIDGKSGVHFGSDTPPDGVNFWIDPNGEPSSVEEWEFDIDDGTTEAKTVVVLNSEDSANGDRAAILKIRQSDGTFVEIPALIGRKGDRGERGEQGERGNDGYTPQKNVDYFDGKDGMSPTHSWDGTVLTITTASGTSSVDLKGDRGERGEQGERGLQGEQGIQGIQGLRGEQGVQGIQGEKGDKGDKGESGITVPADGFFTLSVDDDGNLYVHTNNNETIPNFEYDTTTGNLYFIIEEV